MHFCWMKNGRSTILVIAGLLLVGTASAAVTASMSGTNLNISTTAGSSVTVTVSAGNIKINGNDPLVSGVPTAVASTTISFIAVTGDSAPNVFDLSAITAADMASFASCSVNPGGDSDTVHGSQIMDFINSGAGDDILNGNGGTDILTWSDTNGADTIDLGAGSDIVQLYAMSPGGSNLLFQASGASCVFSDSLAPAFSITVSNGEQFTLGGSADLDTLMIGDLSGTSATNLSVNLYEGDDQMDASACSVPINYNSWGTSSGSDTLVAGSGVDNFFGSGDFGVVGDVWTLTAVGAISRLQRTAVTPVTLDLTGFEKIGMNPASGNDSFTVGDLSGTAVTSVTVSTSTGVDLFDASATAVDCNVSWVDGDGDDVFIAGSGRNNFQFLGSGSATGDLAALQASGASLQFTRSNLTPVNVFATGFQDIRVNMGTGDDQFTVGDLSGTPAETLEFEGSSGNDTLNSTAAAIDVTCNWWNGDGNDTITTGSGHDTQTVLTNSFPDTVDLLTLGASGSNALFQRINGVTFSVTTDGVEEFEVNGAGLSDDLTLSSLVGTDVNLVTFTGFTGNDNFDGTASTVDQVAIWNEGDGSDGNVFGGANGLQIVNTSNDGSTGDVLTMTDASGSPTLVRTNLTPFTVTMDGAAELQVNSLAGSDSLDVGNIDLTSVSHIVFTGGTGSDSLSAINTNTDITSIYASGDGSDSLQFGSGDDTQVINGSPTGGDVFTLGALGASSTFARTNLGPFSLGMNAVEFVEVNGLGGNDSLSVANLAGTIIEDVAFNGGDDDDTAAVFASTQNTYTLDGGGNTALEDVLVVDVDGQTYTQNAGDIVVAGRQTVAFSNFEDISVLNAPSGVDDWALLEE